MSILMAAALAASGCAAPAEIDMAAADEARSIEARLDALRARGTTAGEVRVAQWHNWYNGWSDWRNWRNW